MPRAFLRFFDKITKSNDKVKFSVTAFGIAASAKITNYGLANFTAHSSLNASIQLFIDIRVIDYT